MQYPSWLSRIALIFFVIFAACDDSARQEIGVRVVSDLAPGAEVLVARVEVFESRGASRSRRVATAEHRFESAAQLSRGVTVAQIGDVEPGTYELRVALLHTSMEPVVERRLVVEVIESRVFTVHMTRDCAGVVCGDDALGARACLRGRCVRETCTPETPQACPADLFCASDAECAVASPCGTGRCESGVCLFVPLRTSCHETEWCALEEGCAPIDKPELPRGPDPRCGTICRLEGRPCEYGYYACETRGRETTVTCTAFLARPVGAPCGDGSVCDEAQVCVGAQDGGVLGDDAATMTDDAQVDGDVAWTDASDDAGPSDGGVLGDDAATMTDDAQIDGEIVGADGGMDADIDAARDAESAQDAGMDTGVDAAPDAEGPLALAYVKAPDGETEDFFGWAVALSGDGATLAVGAPHEDTGPGGVGVANEAGAVYVFVKNAGEWSHQATVKAHNAEAGDTFGASVALSYVGDVLVVGAPNEDSGSASDSADNGASQSGAVYVFDRTGSTWTEAAYVKPDVIGAGDNFGFSVAVSFDGVHIAAGAPGEDSAASSSRPRELRFRIDGDGYFAVTLPDGAQAYTRDGRFVVDEDGTLRSRDGFALQPGVVVPEDTERLEVDATGTLSVFVTGSTTPLDIGALQLATFETPSELAPLGSYRTQWLRETLDSGSPLVGPPGSDGRGTVTLADATDNSADGTGAAYVFRRDGATFVEKLYAKPDLDSEYASFGLAVTIATDGQTLVAGAPYARTREASSSGSLTPTVYIDGGGYFQVALEGGGIGYTRKENFSLSVDGQVLVGGYALEPALYVPGDTVGIDITLDGRVFVYTTVGGAAMEVGSMELANFVNPPGLADLGDGIFGETMDSNPPVIRMPDGSPGFGYLYVPTSASTERETGAVYLFRSNATTGWGPGTRLVPDDLTANEQFGMSVALSGTDEGDTDTLLIAAGSPGFGDDAGAVRIFRVLGDAVSVDPMVAPPHGDLGDVFGTSVDLSADGRVLLIGAPFESSAASGVDGDGTDNSALQSGAAYAFVRNAGNWAEGAYVKALAPGANDFFGRTVCLDHAGTTYAIGAIGDDGATGPSGYTSNDHPNTGAVYVGSLDLDD